MIRKFQTLFLDLKLKQKLILIILSSILVQNLILLAFSNKLLYNKEIKSAKQHMENECFLIQNQFETQYQNTIVCSNELIKNINQLMGTVPFKNTTKNLLESSFRYNLHLFPFLDSILFYAQNEQELIYAGTEIPPDSDAILKRILSGIPDKGIPQDMFLDINYRPDTGITSEPVLTFCKRVIQIDTGNTLGYLIFNIKESKISGLFTNTDQHYYLLNPEGNIVSSTHKKELMSLADEDLRALISTRKSGNGFLKLSDEDSLITWVELEKFDYVLLNQTSISDLTVNIRHNTYLILIVCSLTLINISLLIGVFSYLVTNPLEYLTRKIHKVEEGDLKTRSHLLRKDEFGDISDSFNQMVQEIEKLTDRIKTEENQKRRYELSLIQSQINPHFFYNVLDLIYVMCFQRESREAAAVTKYLADYYRSSLSNGKEFIPLKEEFDIVKSYLSIQKYRYDDILDYQLFLQPAVEHILIPKMTLQPLVENALYHGLKESAHSGKIIVKAHRVSGYIFLSVRDDGAGMEETFMQQLLQSSENQGHFGLKSVILRLTLYYGEAFRYRIFSRKNEGTTILLRISDKIMRGEKL